MPRGAVAVDGGSTKKEALEQEHKASLHARRSAMTFVCSVCDDTIVQRALPQVIIGNERVPPPERGEHLEQQRHRQYFGLAPKELVGEWGHDGPDYSVAGRISEGISKNSLLHLEYGCMSLSLHFTGGQGVRQRGFTIVVCACQHDECHATL